VLPLVLLSSPMSVTKRSVSLDDQVAERVEHAAREDGVSFSTWLSVAGQRQLLVREGIHGVAEWEADAGPLSSGERAAGEALLDRLLSSAGEPSRR
jgi:hypothetical protein